jgi:hypothetical protein
LRVVNKFEFGKNLIRTVNELLSMTLLDSIPFFKKKTVVKQILVFPTKCQLRTFHQWLITITIFKIAISLSNHKGLASALRSSSEYNIWHCIMTTSSWRCNTSSPCFILCFTLILKVRPCWWKHTNKVTSLEVNF